MVHLTDPIGDLLTRIRNAQAAGRTQCSAPWSHLKEDLARLLKREGWIADAQVTGEDPKRVITIVFEKGHPSLELKRVSKPGRRVYSSVKSLKPVLRGFGHAILTTSQGLMTDQEARKKKMGGEVLCTIA
ncbi:MAG: 30S ribosomal protein S8 [Candidatus Peribacteraceae bacterium]|nr:30S ribosomal protein S8 [Candidatus Peribacteraceae bacterium]